MLAAFQGASPREGQIPSYYVWRLPFGVCLEGFQPRWGGVSWGSSDANRGRGGRTRNSKNTPLWLVLLSPGKNVPHRSSERRCNARGEFPFFGQENRVPFCGRDRGPHRCQRKRCFPTQHFSSFLGRWLRKFQNEPTREWRNLPNNHNDLRKGGDIFSVDRGRIALDQAILMALLFNSVHCNRGRE
jgi:hypothetical protein